MTKMTVGIPLPRNSHTPEPEQFETCSDRGRSVTETFVRTHTRSHLSEASAQAGLKLLRARRAKTPVQHPVSAALVRIAVAQSL